MQKFQADPEMTKFWDVTTTSTMFTKKNEKRTFISSMEAKNYPIIATIFHPDRMTHEFMDDKDTVNNNPEAIELNKHFGDYLINMA